MDFIALVDGQLRSFLSESENCKSFFCTQLAMFCTEHFDTRHGVTFPEDADFDADVVLDLITWCSRWNIADEVVREGVRFFVAREESLGVLHMLLNVSFDVLLGVTNVLFTHHQTCCLVHHDQVPAFPKVRATSFVPDSCMGGQGSHGTPCCRAVWCSNHLGTAL